MIPVSYTHLDVYKRQADRELLTLCSCCPCMEIGKDIIPVLDYYESRNAVELTKKIQSIPSFHGVKAPMTRRKQGWIPDFSSRYFTEDVPLVTKPICCLAEQLNIPVPTLQTFVEWNTSILNRFRCV